MVSVQLRIKADFKRLPLVKFECLWANNSFFCTVIVNSLNLVF